MTQRAPLAMQMALAATVLLGLTGATSAMAEPISVETLKIDIFRGMPIGGQVDRLVWRGGLELTGPDDFGGLSGITFIDETNLVMVSDRGRFVSGRIIFNDNGELAGLQQVDMTRIANSKGEPLPPNYSRDAEAVELIIREGAPAAVRVGFENLTRVADFALENNQPVGAAREVAIPEWLSDLRTNESLEAVCIAPPASPIAGSTLLITEGRADSTDDHAAWLLGNLDKGPISLTAQSGYRPTDCAFLPDGDLLVLERGTGFLAFIMQVRRISADQVRPNARMQGDVILSASGSDIDNMEGIAVRRTAGGAIRIVLLSDDNFNDWERTLLLEFELPGEG